MSAFRLKPLRSFPIDSQSILRSWFKLNRYPTLNEIEAIAAETHLTRGQVINWFNNERRRIRMGKLSREETRQFSHESIETQRASKLPENYFCLASLFETPISSQEL